MEIQLNNQAQAYFNSLPYCAGWASTSRHPKPYPAEIYSFDVHIAADQRVTFRHRLYGAYTWYVTFTGTPQAIQAMNATLVLG